ncbi:tripartite tricarboxylate transporter substrate binding protein [Halalkalibacter alkaliphilus]|uniref:Tripartite tricarboxylate transporter substrate binding protein n=1 Tax=Halalkalibacter alkaliphilus TaxID=2917993 RepID=A0A9X2CTI0_9BACI|nr:tripartite tricarboxylate transporter substrate binding protein [Halalkalibacter alkaliphilus]MCL7747972.1 tripartite tricarboxylate transporter substrate binding protein [Halalkalibacter alkaliphilus]
MKKKTFKLAITIFIVSLSAILLVGCGGKEASVDSYPEREIEMIIPWAPGGGSDIEGRLVTEHAQNQIDTTFVNVNLPGVGGTVGLEELEEKEANGYHLGQIHEGLLVAHHSGITPINFDNFIPIAAMSTADQILAVASHLDVTTLEEFVELGQSEEIRFGGTVSGIPRVWLEQMGQELDIQYNLVGYEGLGEAIQALAGGHIDAAIVDYPSAKDFVEAGHMNFLAVGTQERLDHASDVPTFIESGYDIVLSINRGYVAPIGTPQEIIDYLGQIFEETANDPAYIEAVTNAGAGVNFMGPEEYKAHLESQDAIIKAIIEDIEASE